MRLPAFALAPCLALGACDESSGPDGQGTFVIATTTTGGDTDLDGYQVRLDDQPGTALKPTDEQTYTVPAGQHVLEFSGIAPNCTPAGETRRTVVLPAGETVRVDLSVACLRTGISVSTTALGVDFDGRGYQVIIDGFGRGAVTANGTFIASRLEPGEHTVGLRGSAPNCTLDGSPTRTVTVVNAELSPIAFSASCVSTFGALRVEVTSPGALPFRGYTVEWSTSPSFTPSLSSRNVAANDVFHESPVSGVLYVRLTQLAANCAVPGGTSREVEVEIGTLVRDTAVVDFHVECEQGNGTFRLIMSASDSQAPDEFTVTLTEAGCPDPYCLPTTTHTVAANGVTNIVAPSARYRVSISSGPGCTGFSRTHDLAIGATIDLEFHATCGPPLVRVTAPTTGSNQDDAYRVILSWDYGDQQVDLPLAAGATLEYLLLRPNYVWVRLRDVAANCTVNAPNPSAAGFVNWGQVLDVTFPVTCGP